VTDRPTADEVVFDVQEHSRFELRMDGELLGFCDYEPRRLPVRLVFSHVEVNPRYRGIGLATRLVRAAALDVRARGGLIDPVCTFAVAFFKSHPEFSDVLFVPPVDPLLIGLERF
jgi:predicted GNAT family acetyltransferase